MSRILAREEAVKIIFEYVVNLERNDFHLGLITQDLEVADKDFIELAYNGVIENYDFLTSIIKDCSQGYSIERVYKMDKAILCLAIFEILFCKDIPDKVSINEAIDITKKYSSERSSSFNNGILASVLANKNNIEDKLASWKASE